MLENRSVARRVAVLDHAEPAAATVDVILQALLPEARFVLRLPFADAERIGTVAGVKLDLPINRFAAGARVAARLGPDEWMLIAPEADAEVLHADVSNALSGLHHALVDISHRNVGMAVVGKRAADVINAGCPLDLGATKFPAGSVTRTLFGKAEIVLFHLPDVTDAEGMQQPHYRIECWRSFGRYVAALLAEAARG